MTTRRFFLKTASAMTLGGIAEISKGGISDRLSSTPWLLSDATTGTASRPTIGTGNSKVNAYLERMSALSSVIDQAIASGQQPLAKHSVFLIHHLTGEVLGVIAALRKLGCRDIVTVFVGYNHDLEKAYRPDLDDLPDAEFRCYVLDTDPTTPAAAEPTYVIPASFLKQPPTDPMSMIDAINVNLKAKHLDFIEAMRALIVPMSLMQIGRAGASGRQFLIVEDGGYLSPILNEAALSGSSVSDFRMRYFAPEDKKTDALLPPVVKDAVAQSMVGSVEHTRNGYDFDMLVQMKYGKLNKPMFSIAVSYLKTQVESDTVAAAILNAIESVLYSCGVGLRDRRVLVFGSRGNLGRRLMAQLQVEVDSPAQSLIGCDLKVGRADTKDELPSWQFRPSQSSAHGASEVATYAEVNSGRTRALDLIIGVTGGPTPGHPVLQVQDVVAWLLDGQPRNLYIASGSTKTDEFPELLSWMNSLLSSVTVNAPVAITNLGGRRTRVQKEDVVDLLSGRRFGSRYRFVIEQPDGSQKKKSLVFLQDLTPINFLFYGEPTEVIDKVLAQLVSASLAFVRESATTLEPRMYAVDYDPEASKDVYGARAPANGKRIPPPRPSES